MNLEQYSESVENTRARLESIQIDALHMLLGIISEVGELTDVYKKNIAYGKDIDWVNVQEEIGDLMWYIIGLCNINGWKLNDILEQNAHKLKARYPNKFESDKALNRDLPKEREILEMSSRINDLFPTVDEAARNITENMRQIGLWEKEE